MVRLDLPASRHAPLPPTPARVEDTAPHISGVESTKMLGRLFGYGSSLASSHASSCKRENKLHQVNESLYEFQKPECSPSMQIVFFHGIHLGDSTDAHLDPWEREDGSFWPQDWLSEAFPEAHIFTATYSGGVGKGLQGSFDLFIIAENLLGDMMKAKIGLRNCPVVLVGYCFGGIVIKELCLHASKPNKTQGNVFLTFLNNIRGIFFYGTPHHGFSSLSNQVDFSESELLADLKILSKVTARRKQEFERLRDSCENWRIHGVGESLPTKSELFPNIVAVPEASARYGDVFSIVLADHSSITKPVTQIDRRYSALRDLLQIITGNYKIARPENYQFLPNYMIHTDAGKEIVSKLESVKILGLVGMGGLGKSTLAKAVFNTLTEDTKFDYSCFVSEAKWIKGERKDVMKEEVWKCMHFHGRKVAEACNLSNLRGKPLLLVLDDVSDRDVNVLEDLAKDTHPASRFIWTSREHHQVEEGEVYEVPNLDVNDAELLFKNHAFTEPAVPSELESLVRDIVKKCDGLPLALEVVGKYLRRKEKLEFWKQTLSSLEKAGTVKAHNEKLWAKLRLSFDDLEENEKQVFLDATNFFSGNLNWTLREAKIAWSASYGTGELLWQTLVDMSLVYHVKEDERIRVHEQLQSLGRMLASEGDHIGKYQVLEYRAVNETGTLKMLQASDALYGKGVHALRVAFTSFHDSKVIGSADVDSEALRVSLPLHDLPKLRFLEVDWPIQIAVKKQISLPTQLVLLKCARPDLLSKSGLQDNLTILDLSRLKDVPDSIGQLSSLAFLRFNSCTSLQSLPESFGQLRALQTLELRSSHSLERLPESFVQLTALRDLSFFDCWSLQSLPESFGQLGALQDLRFHRCEALKSLPDSFGQLRALRNLRFRQCRPLMSLPETFGQLMELRSLSFSECNSLQSLPKSFGKLRELRDLSLNFCPQLRSLPESFVQLKRLRRLRFDFNESLQRLPESFGQLTALQDFRLDTSVHMESLPKSFGHLGALRDLRFYCCLRLMSLPETFGQLSSLEHLSFEKCPNLSLPESVFDQFTKLQMLSLNIRLEKLPHSMKSLRNLRQLQLMGLSATNIPDFIRTLPSLSFVEILCAQRTHPWPTWLVDRTNLHWSSQPDQKIYQVFEVCDGTLSLIEEGPIEFNWLTGKCQGSMMFLVKPCS